MNETQRVPATKLTGAFGAMLTFATRKMFGRVPDSMGVMWNNPRVLKDMMSANRRAEKWNELDENLGVLARMAPAAAVGCSLCLDLNYFLAHRRGLDDSKIRQVPRWQEASVFTPLERRVMEYADAMSRTPPAVTDDLSATLLDDLGGPALIELTARVAMMNMAARANIALGIRSEEFSTSCGLFPLAADASALRSTT